MKKHNIIKLLLFVILLCVTGIYLIINADNDLPPGEGLKIVKYPGNFAAFKFMTKNGAIIVADPYGMTEYVRADVVTISHHHGDHCDMSHIQGSPIVLDKADAIEHKGILIRGVAGVHNKGDIHTTNVIFMYNLCGIRLAHFASQGDVPTEAMYDLIGTVDVLLIQCIDIPSKLSPDEVIGIARRLKAKIVIPEHGRQGLLEKRKDFFSGNIKNIKSGEMRITKKELSAIHAPMIINLDM